MTFEKAKCEKCGKFTICYYHLDDKKITTIKGYCGEWFCDPCFSWVIENAELKDEIAEIFRGIEDIEFDRMEVS